MSRTLRFGEYATLRIASRIDRMVVRRRTHNGYDAHAELAYRFAMNDSMEEARRDLHSRRVAEQVSPRLVRAGQPGVTPTNAFGKRA